MTGSNALTQGFNYTIGEAVSSAKRSPGAITGFRCITLYQVLCTDLTNSPRHVWAMLLEKRKSVQLCPTFFYD